MVAGSWVALLAFWHTCAPFELSQSVPTHLLAFICDLWVRLSDSSALSIAIHLEALVGVDCCGFSCYSWWLPPPRWLGAAEEVRQELVLVLGRLPIDWIVRGCCGSSAERRIPTLVNCSCQLQLLARLVGSYGAYWEAQCVIPISHWTTRWRGTQCGRRVSASTWTMGINLCHLLPLWSIDCPSVQLVFIGLHLDWLAHSTPLGETPLTHLCNYLYYTLLLPLCSC
jgi:hypothetical protein